MSVFDYVKLVVRNDGAADHQEMAANWQSNARIIDPSEKSWKVSVVGGKGGYTSNTVLEIWGVAADSFAWAMPPSWWCYLRRLDYREALYTDPEADAGLALEWAFLARPRGVNTAALDSKPRHKNNKRDVGGQGLVIGSRKSARHCVFYKRGTDNPVFEFRAQDQLALDIGKAAMLAGVNGPETQSYLCAMRGIEYEVDRFLRKYLGTPNAQTIFTHWQQQGAAHDEQLEKLLAATQQPDFWDKAAEEMPDLPGLYDWPPSPSE